MKNILIHDPFASNSQMFDPNERDKNDYGAIKLLNETAHLEGALTRVNDPLIYLRERLLQYGYNLKSADRNSLDNCEWVFFYNAISVRPYSGWRGLARKIKAIITGRPLVRNLYKECIQAGMGSRMALFLWEAPAVSPENMDPELHKLFPVIFTSHDELVDGHKFFKVCVPQMRLFPDFPKIDFDQRKLLVNISMNKYSSHPNELYSARRTSIRYFEEAHPNNFDLFGLRWNKHNNFIERFLSYRSKHYKSYIGAVKNKWEVMPKYRFSLCYENVRDVPGYVTEKIFDSIRCGCVPIYWGANNIEDYVDSDVFIDRRRFKTDAELDEYISKITQHEYDLYQNAIQKYLTGPKFAKFSSSVFAETIVNTLKL
jgi:hypothetical protein